MENRKFLYVGGISLFRDRYLCVPFYPASSSRVYSLSRVSLYSKCVEACVSRSVEQWNTRARHFADTVSVSLSGSLGEGSHDRKKNLRNYLKWKCFKNFLSYFYRRCLKVSGHSRAAKPLSTWRTLQNSSAICHQHHDSYRETTSLVACYLYI